MNNQTLPGPISLLSSSWVTLKTNWKIFMPIAIVPSALIYLGQLFGLGRNPLGIIVSVIAAIAGAVLSIAIQPALIDAANKIASPEAPRLTVKGQYAIGFRYFWPIIGLVILQMLVFFGSVIFLVIPAIVVGEYSCMIVMIRVLEGKGGLSAFTESYSLVKGRWWKSLGRTLFLALVFSVMSLVAAGATFLLTLPFGILPSSLGHAIVSDVLFLAVNVIVGPLAVIYIYNWYVALKASRAADVVVSGFKKWIVSFIVVGILAVLLLPAALGMLAYKAFEGFKTNPSYMQQTSIPYK